MPQQAVYDPILKRAVTLEEAQALNAERKAAKKAGLGGTTTTTTAAPTPGVAPAPPEETRATVSTSTDAPPGLLTPPSTQGLAPAAEEDPGLLSFIQSIPELAALGASFIPGVGQASMVGRLASGTGIPAAAGGLGEAVRQLLSGGGIDTGQIVERSVWNAVPGAVGGPIAELGTAGNRMMRSAIGAGRKVSAPLDVTGKVVKPRDKFRLTLPVLRTMAETAKKHGASLSEAGIDKLMRKSVELENAALKATGPQLRQIEAQIDELDRLIPELRETLNTKEFSLPRFAAGSGLTAGLTMGGLTAVGVDPSTASIAGMGVGLPVGFTEASPAARLAVGKGLSRGPIAGKGLETLLRLILAGIHSDDARDPLQPPAAPGATR